MSLTLFWKNNKKDIETKFVKQLVSLAGNGELKDHNATSIELREFFGTVPLDALGRYMKECLEGGFSDSGLVLQDIVNELGVRLGCSVKPGRYRGTANQIGFDGLWRFPNGYAIVVEVKTTDTYNISLDKVATYRKRLIADGTIDDDSSVLIVVGRQDTGSLEAQVRGSRHGWDVRLISADKLFRLVEIKHEADSSATIEKIQTVLRPLELTRVDFIIDLLSSATDEIKDTVDEEQFEAESKEPQAKPHKKFTPVAFNEDVAERVSSKLGLELQRSSKTVYSTLDKQTSVRCLVSKSHEKSNGSTYWYAFHTYYKDALSEYQNSYIAFGCGSTDKILLFKLKEFVLWLDRMNKTEREDRTYWHIQFFESADKFTLTVKGGGSGIDVTQHLV